MIALTPVSLPMAAVGASSGLSASPPSSSSPAWSGARSRSAVNTRAVALIGVIVAIMLLLVAGLWLLAWRCLARRRIAHGQMQPSPLGSTHRARRPVGLIHCAAHPTAAAHSKDQDIEDVDPVPAYELASIPPTYIAARAHCAGPGDERPAEGTSHVLQA